MDTERKSDRGREKTQRHDAAPTRNVANTHFGSKTLVIVNIKAACHW